ncbi:MAG: tetrahydrodipicolinate N-succinyltransferase [Corynebacterium sp.]|nr:tetrahydrodipicolinate N-succinyltransferase [Corynebacterium sp.]
MRTDGAKATGIANIAADGTVLDTWYPAPALAEVETTGTRRLSARDLSPRFLSLIKIDEGRMVEQVAVETNIADLSSPPVDAHDAYLRLHLLSHRVVTPGSINMDGLLDRLSMTVWTNKGPCLPENFEFVRTTLRARGLVHVYGIERIPRMVDYVVPSRVQVAEADRVRLGAYLAPGTIVQRSGYISYNAGTYGPTQLEGRITSGVTLGEDSTMQLGSGAISTDQRPMYIGRFCTIGYNTMVVDVSIGDHCTIASDLILTPDSLVIFADGDGTPRPIGPTLDPGWNITALHLTSGDKQILSARRA